MRRCVFGCSPVAKFLDEDRHLCSNHRDEFDEVEEKEEVPQAVTKGTDADSRRTSRRLFC